jgi:hypothetical protein
MNRTEFYIKNSDGEFELARLYDDQILDAWPVGSTLVTVSGNAQSRTYNVEPDYIALAAAAQYLRDQLSKILIEAMSPKHQDAKQELTDEQKELWDQLRQTNIGGFWFPSAYTAAEEVLNKIIEAAKPAVNIPWVQDAAEQYRTAMALALNTKENEN